MVVLVAEPNPPNAGLAVLPNKPPVVAVLVAPNNPPDAAGVAVVFPNRLVPVLAVLFPPNVDAPPKSPPAVLVVVLPVNGVYICLEISMESISHYAISLKRKTKSFEILTRSYNNNNKIRLFKHKN